MKHGYDYVRFQLSIKDGKGIFKCYNRYTHKHETFTLFTVADLRRDIANGITLARLADRFDTALAECVAYQDASGFDCYGDFNSGGWDASYPQYEFNQTVHLFELICKKLGAK